ncbi:hypothetical protein GCM10010983_04730 [Caulobacter rhizosphaerae]|nr:hypothetical protein GCM10010983_04730 [Caulobacter rhizosphaerae]
MVEVTPGAAIAAGASSVAASREQARRRIIKETPTKAAPGTIVVGASLSRAFAATRNKGPELDIGV